ncbi:MAG: hypothetical protein LC640_12440, partial [Frankia sp.]|nr:hypothetical protein [Frankia sp.]
HVSALLRKLDAADRRALSAIAREQPGWRKRSGSGAPVVQLPARLTSFVGRGEECQVISDRLAEWRLVTLAGPAGVGKTRLAIEVADQAATQFADGVWFADLTPAVDAPSVLAVVCRVLDVKDEPGRTPMDSLLARTADARALLVLDNCEHVVAPAAELAARIVRQSAGVAVIATSREHLDVPEETVFPVAPLDTPIGDASDLDAIATSESVMLLVDRAHALQPDFALTPHNAAAVASICRRLDGVPLALELAAAPVHALGPAEVDARLADRFTLLQGSGRGRDARHQGLHAALTWSHDLLDATERAVFERLAVFRGTFSLDAIESVITDDDVPRAVVPETLTRLVRKSLVVPEAAKPDESERRYRLLETMREFAWQRLSDDGGIDRWRERHFEWAMDLASRAAAGLGGEQQASWLDALGRDLDNLESAFAFSVQDPGHAARALDAVLGLSNFWLARGIRRAQGTRWCQATAAAAVERDVASRTQALLTAVLLTVWSDPAAAARVAETAARLAGDDRTAGGYADIATALAKLFLGDPAAQLHARRAVDGLPEDNPMRLWARGVLGLAHAHAGELQPAYDDLVGVSEVFKARTGDTHLYGGWRSFAADVAAARDERETASALARESLSIARDISCESCESQALASLSMVDPCDDIGGPIEAARQAVGAAHHIGEVFNVLGGLEALVGALAAASKFGEAARIAAATAGLRDSTGIVAVLPGRAGRLREGLDAARAALPADEFSASWAEGSALAYEDVIRAAVVNP